MASGFSLKDQLFNQEKIRYLADLFSSADASFDALAFEEEVMSKLLGLELKERMAWIAEVLGRNLPETLPELAPILLKALPEPLDPGKRDDDFGDFIFAPLGELVVARGLPDHMPLALDLIEEITQRFSMEWAIRAFFHVDKAQTLKRMEAWAEHPNYHVRRLVSEGSRPRLPWGTSIPLDVAEALPLLDRLYGDPTRYVTRSVANHLNDVSKKDPDLVLKRLRLWADERRQEGKELDWMTAHACRGLIKDGHAGALLLLGYDPSAQVEAKMTLKSKNVRIGEYLEFEVQLNASERTPVIVDYIIEFQRSAGKSSQKVYKLKKAIIQRKMFALEKRHLLKGDATTFKLHPGHHKIELLVNGVVRAESAFELLA
ncbi:hypothetical protein RSK20926_16397 [Roseobacter sp. SK209-2-6]|uniref:DNA alkylation repair protein n=1 Tax=Roseobacter sp. SK209-2-6 TaxID=388739 RepID=UPI0000F3CFC0|nr:DNA alkylation repair protein [Roseobacter sp. SK209-2-6]EBA15254.1 hypothetical protein RSK20926_16397 [Roseobacter sp. SK209-2-6]